MGVEGSVSEIGGVRTTVIAMTHVVGAPTGAAVHTHRFPVCVWSAWPSSVRTLGNNSALHVVCALRAGAGAGRGCGSENQTQVAQK